MFHTIQRIDVHTPAARAPGQRQTAVRRLVGHQAGASAIQIAQGLSQAVQALVGFQCPGQWPHGLITVAGKPDRQIGAGHALVAPEQPQAGIGPTDLQTGFALSQAPAARHRCLAFHFPDRFLACQQQVGLALRAQRRLAGLQPGDRPATQAEHARCMGLDSQAPFTGMQRPFDAGGRRHDRAGLENLVRQFDGG